MNQKEKLAHLMGHWIEHNEAHTEEYRKWAEVAKEDGLTDVSEAIYKAISKVNEITRILEDAQELLGGNHTGHEHTHGHGGCHH